MSWEIVLHLYLCLYLYVSSEGEEEVIHLSRALKSEKEAEPHSEWGSLVTWTGGSGD